MLRLEEVYNQMASDARHVVALSLDEALRFNHNYIGTEHLLLGLLRSNKSPASVALASMGVTLNKARSATEFIIGRGEPSAVLGVQIGLTPRAQHTLRYAVTESLSLGHPQVQSIDLLLGLLREGDSIAVGILKSLGVNLNRAREAAFELDSNHNAGEPTSRPTADNINYNALLQSLLDLSDEDFDQIPEILEHAKLLRYGILFQTLESK